MKNIYILIVLAAFAFTGISQVNNDAVFEKITKKYTLNEDGSIDYRVTKQLKLNSHFAFHRLYGETFIVYNTDFQSLKINSAYTIMKDGKKVITPDNAFNEVLPSFCNNSPAYNHIQEMVVTHTALEVGATIFLDYTIHSKSGYSNGMFGNELLYCSSPTKDLTIEITIPGNEELHFKLLNIDKDFDSKITGSSKIYKWHFTNLPANSKDRFQPEDHVNEPQLHFTTVKFQKAISSFLENDAYNMNTCNSMDEVVEEVVLSNPNDLMIALKFREIVATEMGNLNIPLKYTGYRYRDPITTWKSNQGTQIEKAILLKTLLNKANIKSDIITFFPTSFFGTSGNLDTFLDFAIKVDTKSHRDFYIYPNKINQTDIPFGLYKMAILALKPSQKRYKPLMPKAEESKIEFYGEIILKNTDSIAGEIVMDLNNELNPYYTLYKDTAYIKQLIRGVNGITDYEMIRVEPIESQSAVVFKSSSALQKIGNYFIYDLPYSSTGISSWNMKELPADRTVPLQIPETISEGYEYVILLPDNSQIIVNEPEKIIENEIGAVRIIYYQDEDKVRVTRTVDLFKNIIEPEEYISFKSLIDLWNNNNYNKLVFKTQQ
jgi:hypothetical protein